MGGGCAQTLEHLRYRVERKRALNRDALDNLFKSEVMVINSLRDLLKELEPFHWHFQATHRQQACYDELLEAFPEGTVMWHFDFKQNVSVPQGPREAGSWWYANCRVEYTVFGVLQVCAMLQCMGKTQLFSAITTCLL